jgi:hypothetical protein
MHWTAERQSSQVAKDQPMYDMKKVVTALDQLLDCPDDQRIGVEGRLQRIVTVVVMQENFGMSWLSPVTQSAYRARQIKASLFLFTAIFH